MHDFSISGLVIGSGVAAPPTSLKGSELVSARARSRPRDTAGVLRGLLLA
jgi:hypothetical protein